MKDDNVFKNASTNTGTSKELKLSFTIEHMTLLLMVYDGVRQIEDNLLQITGDLDNTNPESAPGNVAGARLVRRFPPMVLEQLCF